MKIKILVADDSATIQKIVAMAFENEDFTVQGIGNGKDAWDQLAEIRPGIVLADTDMPGMTGYDLSRKIKEPGGFPETRVLLLKSDFEDYDEKLFADSRADSWIAKPFKADEIIKRVKELAQGGAAEETPVMVLSVMDIVEPGEPGEPVMVESSAPGEEPAFLPLSMEDIVAGPAVKEEAPAVAAEASFALSAEDIAAEPEAEPGFELSTEGFVFEPARKEAPAPAAEVNFDLSAEDIVSIPPGFAETAFEEEPAAAATVPPAAEKEPVAVDEVAPLSTLGSAAILDEMVQDLEDLKAEPVVRAEEKSFADVDAPAANLDDLDRAFAQLKNPRAGTGRAAPDLAAGGKRPDVIAETMSFMSSRGTPPKAAPRAEKTGDPLDGFLRSFETGQGDFSKVVGDHIRLILEQSLDRAVEKELAGLSEKVMKTVREIVREVTPRIARELIKEEIQKIKDMEMA